jgi:hypothetical protein
MARWHHYLHPSHRYEMVDLSVVYVRVTLGGGPAQQVVAFMRFDV